MIATETSVPTRHTTSDTNAGGTFGVQLNHLYDITQVNLFDRTDCCGVRIDNSGLTPFTLEILRAGNPVFTQNYTFTQSIFSTDNRFESERPATLPRAWSSATART